MKKIFFLLLLFFAAFTGFTQKIEYYGKTNNTVKIRNQLRVNNVKNNVTEDSTLTTDAEGNLKLVYNGRTTVWPLYAVDDSLSENWLLFDTTYFSGGSGSTAPGGSNTQVQYNNAGSFGGSANFTMNNPDSNYFVDISSTNPFKSALRIRGETGQTAAMLHVSLKDSPGTTNFEVTPTGGTANGSWIFSNGGKISVATAAGGDVEMLSFNNVFGTARKYYFSLSDANIFSIKDIGNNNRFAIASNGDVGIGTTTPATKLDVSGTISQNGFAVKPYQVITGNLTSSGTAITFTQFENTTGTTITATRSGAGLYNLTSSGTPFTTNKTGVHISVSGSSGAIKSIMYELASTSVVTVISTDGFGFDSDELLLNTFIEIKIYP